MYEIAILAEESSVFAASHLARVMKVRLYVILPRYNDILDGGVKGIYWTANSVIKEKDIIVIGYAALKKISADIERFNSIAFIASESTICRERKWVSSFLIKNKNIKNTKILILQKNIKYLFIHINKKRGCKFTTSFSNHEKKLPNKFI